MRCRVLRHLIWVYTVCQSSSNFQTQQWEVNCSCWNCITSMIRSWSIQILRVYTVLYCKKKKRLLGGQKSLWDSHPGLQPPLNENPVLHANIACLISECMMRLQGVQFHLNTGCSLTVLGLPMIGLSWDAHSQILKPQSNTFYLCVYCFSAHLSRRSIVTIVITCVRRPSCVVRRQKFL